MSVVTLPDARVFIGHAVIDGRQVDVTIDMEWMRAFIALVDRTGGVTSITTTQILSLVSEANPAYGRDGEDGRDSFVPGPPGMDGVPGMMGPPGRDGEDGSDRYIYINP